MNDSAEVDNTRPNIYDVAKLAGVSHMTVSRVLNGHPNIRDTTREKVTSAIEKLRFHPSASARALARRRAMRLGVLVDSPVEYGPNSMLHAFEAAAHEAGYAVSSFTTGDDEKLPVDAAVGGLVSQELDGLCVITPRESSMRMLLQRSMNLPMIFLLPDKLEGLSTASVDQYGGAKLAMEHLLELGHRRIAHLGGPNDWFDARERERAWRETLAASGLAAGVYGEGDWTADCGYAWASTLDVTECTAVFAANDQMALGVIHGLSERGIQVPEQMSVVGFDDVPDARHYLPPLTTVRQDFIELGELAVRLLLRTVGGTASSEHTSIDARLIVRESSVSPRSEL